MSSFVYLQMEIRGFAAPFMNLFEYARGSKFEINVGKLQSRLLF